MCHVEVLPVPYFNSFFLLQMELVSSGGEEEGGGGSLLLRMSPHNVPDMSRVDMLAECPLDHPFFVKDKGKRWQNASYSQLTLLTFLKI
jgi:hypothetical protein